jgi:CubicO group peptidase (beta-lactamase class C family)
MSRARLVALVLLLSTFPAPALARQFPPDSAIRRIIQERVSSGRNPGIVVGVMDRSGTRVVSYGTSSVQGVPLDGSTIFEIGSVTKTFTTSLLADMVARGEVRLDEPVAELLPNSVTVPSWEGRPITLLDLATHTSGLPRNPTNLHPSNPEDPWADYTVSDLYQFLSNYKLMRAPGSAFEYSNVGMGLLGHALALRGGKSYEALLEERILRPLGMGDTRITLSAAQQARLAQGHENDGRAVANWHLPTLAGAGALRSDATDLFRYLSANLGTSGGALVPVLAQTHPVRAPIDDTLAVALGWMVNRKRRDRPLWWHDGETGGFRSFVAFDPAGKRAVVVLTNETNSVNDIGFRLLEGPPPPRKRR